MVKHTCSKEADIAVMSTKIKNIEEKVEDIHKMLMGNGRPGLIQRMDIAEGGLKASQWIAGIALICISIYVNYKV